MLEGNLYNNGRWYVLKLYPQVTRGDYYGFSIEVLVPNLPIVSWWAHTKMYVNVAGLVVPVDEVSRKLDIVNEIVDQAPAPEDGATPGQYVEYILRKLEYENGTLDINIITAEDGLPQVETVTLTLDQVRQEVDKLVGR